VDVSTAYRTVARTGEAEVEVKRSRFRGHVERVDSEPAAREVVERIRKQHWDARHHCSAFVLGPDAAVVRSSDDGEPSGTAGAPMLEVLRGCDLSDVVAVVTRWFGGTLLGAGGLVRAYGEAVRAALDAAGVRERRLWQRYDVPADHADAGRLEGELRARGVRVLGVDYTERALLRVAAPSEDFAAVLAGLTAGAVTADHVGAVWLDQ
jgi:uncharacterized YigZ family protein